MPAHGLVAPAARRCAARCPRRWPAGPGDDAAAARRLIWEPRAPPPRRSSTSGGGPGRRTGRRRRGRTKKSDHPSDAAAAGLTRRDVLRLSPRDRADHRLRVLRDAESRRTVLDEARGNLRSNLAYLGEASGDNLKRNVRTLRRLLRGEEVWNDPDPSRGRDGGASVEDVDWRLAGERVRSQLGTNANKLREYLHGATDGMIPAPSTSTSSAGSSVANRLREFHAMKSQTPYDLDGWWILRNVLTALVPGLLVNVYLQSHREEAREYYESVAREERSAANVGVPSGMSGLSSAAFVEEGGDVADKLRTVLGDLFLGGVDGRAGDAAPGRAGPGSSSGAAEPGAGPPDPGAPAVAAAGSVDRGPDGGGGGESLETLVRRIRALEERIGSGGTDAPPRRPGGDGGDGEGGGGEIAAQAPSLEELKAASPLRIRNVLAAAGEYLGDGLASAAESARGDGGGSEEEDGPDRPRSPGAGSPAPPSGDGDGVPGAAPPSAPREGAGPPGKEPADGTGDRSRGEFWRIRAHPDDRPSGADC